MGYIGESFIVHNHTKSQSISIMTMGQGAAHLESTKYKLDARSSPEYKFGRFIQLGVPNFMVDILY